MAARRSSASARRRSVGVLAVARAEGTAEGAREGEEAMGSKKQLNGGELEVEG